MDNKTLISLMNVAVASERGIVLDNVDAAQLRVSFYKARKIAENSSFADLSFQLSTSPSRLLILRKSKMQEEGALKHGQTLTFGEDADEIQGKN